MAGAPEKLSCEHQHRTALFAVLRSYRFVATSEAALGLGIAEAMTAEGLPFEAEVALDAKSRIDFLIPGGLGVELKTDGAANTVLRQLMRYAEFPEISELVLVTTRAKHIDMPDTVRGKPLRVYFVGGLS